MVRADLTVRGYDGFLLSIKSASMGLRRLLEACQLLEKGALKHSSKSTEYEIKDFCVDLVHELSWTYHTLLFLGLY